MNHKPQHIAIVMDGNGRWAKKRFLPRFAGHKAGVNAVRKVVQFCLDNNIQVLTLFAFSSENWLRPETEVNELMGLFLNLLEKEIQKLNENQVKLKVIGDTSKFTEKLQNAIRHAEMLTEINQKMQLNIAANYGGRWDILNATKMIVAKVKANEISEDDITPQLFEQYLSTHNIPDPDLFIRTSGEQRISNFLLWQLSYSELYFTDTLWPDFDEKQMQTALDYYYQRERRFGCISDQLK